MELRSLRHVVALARHLNYKRAADELCLTQPALSRSIQVTEERCGLRLFDRDRSSVHLTASGRMFVRRAEALLREAADFERMLQRCANDEEGEIAFGMSPFAAKACLPRLLKEVVADHPKLKINIPVRMADALLSLLIGEEIDFLICTQNQIPASAPVRSIALGSFSTSLLVRAGHPLLSDRDLDPSAFPIVSSGSFGSSGELSAQLGWRATPTPQVVVESSEGLSELTQGTNAIWITSPMAALDVVAAGKLVELPLPAGQTRQQFQVLMYCLDRRSASSMMLNIEARIRRIIAAA